MKENFNVNKITPGKAVVDILSPIVLIIVIQNIVSIFATQWLFLYEAMGFEGESYTDFAENVVNGMMSASFSTYVSIGYAVLAIFLFGYIYKKNRFIEGAYLGQLKNYTVNKLFFWLGAVIVVVGIQYFCQYFINALAVLFPEWLIEYNELLEQAGLLEDVISPATLIYAVILAPMCEELAFRGLTFKYAKRIMPFWFANAVQAGLFATLHMNKLQAAYTFIFGMLMGFIMEKYNNLFVVIIIHMLFNLAGSVLSAFMISGGSSPIEYFLWFFGSMVVSYGGVVLLDKAAPIVEEKA